MNKKALLKVAFITIILFSAIVVTQLVHLGSANPNIGRSAIPPSDVKPPTISINPLINNTVLAQNQISLTLKVSIADTKAITKYDLHISDIRFYIYWNDSTAVVYDGSGPTITDFSDNLTLADIPEGSHNVTFIANANGVRDGEYSFFGPHSFLTIYFSVDTTSPNVSISSIENKTYETSAIPLNFTVNEPVSQVSYSLDGQENVTVVGNTTLAGLSVGEHNVRVYAWDTAGNVGVSETIYFRVFSTTLFIAAVVTSVPVIGLGLLFYFKKRKR